MCCLYEKRRRVIKSNERQRRGRWREKDGGCASCEGKRIDKLYFKSSLIVKWNCLKPMVLRAAELLMMVPVVTFSHCEYVIDYNESLIECDYCGIYIMI